MEFLDRLLTCADCRGEFIFTAGEQLFFFDKQFFATYCSPYTPMPIFTFGIGSASIYTRLMNKRPPVFTG